MDLRTDKMEKNSVYAIRNIKKANTIVPKSFDSCCQKFKTIVFSDRKLLIQSILMSLSSSLKKSLKLILLFVRFSMPYSLVWKMSYFSYLISFIQDNGKMVIIFSQFVLSHSETVTFLKLTLSSPSSMYYPFLMINLNSNSLLFFWMMQVENFPEFFHKKLFPFLAYFENQVPSMWPTYDFKIKGIVLFLFSYPLKSCLSQSRSGLLVGVWELAKQSIRQRQRMMNMCLVGLGCVLCSWLSAYAFIPELMYIFIINDVLFTLSNQSIQITNYLQFYSFCSFQLQNYIKIMGNQACLCCEEQHAKNQYDDPQIQVLNRVQPYVKEPILTQKVKQHLQQYRPFSDKLTEPKLKKFGNHVFKGKLDQLGRPDGYGMMMYENGSVLVGQFIDGKANGPGHFVLSDGSYYHGTMIDNIAECSDAIFETNNFKYQGEVKWNNLEGKGREEGKNYKFEGTYSKGRRVEGILQWIQEPLSEMSQQKQTRELQYQGSFNKKGKFQGKGILRCPNGVYDGNFKNGQKHGKGEFTFKTGLKYVGDYVQDVRNGQGTIFAKNGQIAYCGQIRNGIPNGRGYVLNSKKEQVYLDWLQGMDKKVLPDEFITASTKKSQDEKQEVEKDNRKQASTKQSKFMESMK